MFPVRVKEWQVMESVSLEMWKTQQNVVALSRVLGFGNLWKSFPNSSENQGVWIHLRVGICGGLFSFLTYRLILVVNITWLVYLTLACAKSLLGVPFPSLPCVQGSTQVFLKPHHSNLEPLVLYWHSQTEMMFFVPFPDLLCRHFAKPGQTLAEAVGEHKLQPFQEEIHVGEHFFSRQVLLRGLGFGIPALLRDTAGSAWL